jgi:hypothetical protein
MPTLLTLPTNNGSGISINIDTSPRIKLESNTCSSVLSSVNRKDVGSFLSKYKIDSLQQNINTILTQVNASSIDGSQPFYWPSNTATIQTYINSIKNADIPTLKFMVNCMEESYSTPDLSAYEEEKNKLDASKKRLEMILHPQNNVSNYEGWFPITRPMHEPSLFILFGIGLLLLLLSVVLFIKTQGVNVNIETPPSFEVTLTSVFQTIKGYALYIASVGVLIGYLVHIYTKK